MTKQEQVEELYQKFLYNCTEDKSSNCPWFLQMGLLISLSYKSLKENWTEEKANSFIKNVNKGFAILGI